MGARYYRRRALCLALCITVVSALLAVPSRAAAEQRALGYSKTEVVAALTDRLTSIDSLYAEYTVTFGISERSKSEQVRPCRFARSGSMWHYGELQINAQESSVTERTYCYDNSVVYSFSVVTANGGTQSWKPSLQVQDRFEQGGFDPDHLLGQKLSNVGLSLVELLKLATTIAIETAVLPDGERGVRLQMLHVPAKRPPGNQMNYDLSVWLDSTHDLLPKRILITESADNVTLPGWKIQWTVTQYQEVTDEHDNRPRWFPIKGVMEQGAVGAPTITIAVDKVTVNADLAESLFRPEIPDGVTVVDATSAGQPSVAIKGGDRGIDRRMVDLAAHAPKSSSRARCCQCRRPTPGIRSVSVLFMASSCPVTCS